MQVVLRYKHARYVFDMCLKLYCDSAYVGVCMFMNIVVGIGLGYRFELYV